MPMPEVRATMSVVVLTDAHMTSVGHCQPVFDEIVKLAWVILRRICGGIFGADLRSSQELTMPRIRNPRVIDLQRSPSSRSAKHCLAGIHAVRWRRCNAHRNSTSPPRP